MKHTRSKERIQELGEVFTPPETVNEMLDLLGVDDWSKEGLTFFEPTCGNGNFVLEIITRRVNALYERYLREGKQFAEARACVEAVHSIWAIDVDETNILDCRHRVFAFLYDWISDRLKIPLVDLYMNFIVMNISDRIFQNECLTGLSANKEDAKKASEKTRASQMWFEKEGYVPMPFMFKRGHP